jgi:hypothetical protein
VDDIFALQDRIVFELTDGLHLALRGSEVASIERRETRSVEAYESYARGMMNLRQATRESLDRAISAFEEALRHDPEYADGLGGARRRAGPQGQLPLAAGPAAARHRDGAARARARPAPRRGAHVEGLGAPGARARGRGDRGDRGGHSDSIRTAARGTRALARAYWVGKGDFAAAIPVFERAIELNPEAGYSYLQLALLLAYEGQYERAIEICRRAIDLQEQFISGNAGLQIVGAHARLGYVYYLMGRYDDALREYERELAFIGSGDHVLRERSLIELNVKVGAVYLGRAHRRRRAPLLAGAQELRRRVATGADDPVHAVLHRVPARAARRHRSRARLAGTASPAGPTCARASPPPGRTEARDHDLRVTAFSSFGAF